MISDINYSYLKLAPAVEEPVVVDKKLEQLAIERDITGAIMRAAGSKTKEYIKGLAQEAVKQ
jgi:hypothetical protein